MANTTPEKRKYLRKSQLWSEDFTAKLFCNVQFRLERLPKLIGLCENTAIVIPSSGLDRFIFPFPFMTLSTFSQNVTFLGPLFDPFSPFAFCAPVAPVEDMIDRPRIFDAEFSGHAAKFAAKNRICQ